MLQNKDVKQGLIYSISCKDSEINDLPEQVKDQRLLTVPEVEPHNCQEVSGKMTLQVEKAEFSK